jgi:N-acetylmuramoyl-L-alanine amidase
MATYTEKFKSLVEAYRGISIEFPKPKPVTIAQWMHESGRGSSKLATDHNNFAGLKWRDEMEGFATPVTYQAHDGTDRYCKFKSVETFITGYWHFLERSPYRGWRDHAASGAEFMNFIGPNYTPTAGYGAAVEGLMPEAESLLASFGGTDGTEHHPNDTHGSSERPPEPPI